MAKAFLNLRDPKLHLTSTLPFGKFAGCRVCDILEENYAYVLWLHGKQPNLFHKSVVEEAEQFVREALEKVHYEEEVKPFLGSNNWFSDWDEDIPF